MSAKTPVTILQELSTKQNTCPHYEYVDSTSTSFFRCKVSGMGLEALGDGRCKKDAKQEAARLLLKKLAEVGKYFPTNSDNLSVPSTTPEVQDTLLNSVALLTDFCTTYRMAPPEFEFLHETGPPHYKKFTIRCKVGMIERVATALSKKHAKQMAASIVLNYFKDNMNEKLQEMMKSQDVGMTDKHSFAEEKYAELSNATWRPNLGYVIANYHYGLNEIEKEHLDAAKEFFNTLKFGPNGTQNNVEDIEKILGILQLEHTWEPVESCSGSNIVFLKVPHATPPIFIAGSSLSLENAKNDAAHKALIYIKQMLHFT